MHSRTLRHSKLAPLHSKTLAGQRRHAHSNFLQFTKRASGKRAAQNNRACAGPEPKFFPCGGMHLFQIMAPINWSLLGGSERSSISLSSWFDGHFVLFYRSDNHQLRPDFGSRAHHSSSRSLSILYKRDPYGGGEDLIAGDVVHLSLTYINLSIHLLWRFSNGELTISVASPSTCAMRHSRTDQRLDQFSSITRSAA